LRNRAGVLALSLMWRQTDPHPGRRTHTGWIALGIIKVA
jgi:hypothetical protein